MRKLKYWITCKDKREGEMEDRRAKDIYLFNLYFCVAIIIESLILLSGVFLRVKEDFWTNEKIVEQDFISHGITDKI